MSCERNDINDKLLLFVDGSLSKEEYDEMKEHIADCGQCRSELDGIADVTATLHVTADHIKERWIHPKPEELYTLALEPEKLERQLLQRFSAHVSLCKACAAEVEMLKNAPQLEGDESESVEMPEKLINAFRKEYAFRPSRGNVPELKDPEELTWLDKLILFLKPKWKLAYVSMAGVLMVVFVVALILGHINYTGTTGSGMTRSYTELVAVGVPERHSYDIFNLLNDRGIDARLKNGKIMVDRDDVNEATTMVHNYERKIKKPAPGIYTGPGTKIVKDDRRNDDFFFNMKEKETELVSDSSGRFPEHAPSSVYGRQPIISAFSVVEDRESDQILNRYAKYNSSSVIGVDMEERQRETMKLQKQFRAQIKKVLKSYPKASASRVKVYPTLSFNKDEKGNYGVRSITVIIEHPAEISDDEKKQIVQAVKKEINWDESWGETFLFLRDKPNPGIR